MICEYYHKKYSTNYLSSLCNTTTEGVSMLSIRDTAFALEIESNCGKVNIKGRL
ncbi:cysteine peptidase family C39 domain-containing protein [Prevotella melaninogenica]